jgi:PAS domain S-box-containing protein
MRKLAAQIRNNLDMLAGEYNRRLKDISGYSEMPDPLRLESARNTWLVIAAGLEAGDAEMFTQFVQTIAKERIAQGFEVDSVQRALTCLIDILEPGLSDVTTANFLWRTMVQVHVALSQVTLSQVRTVEQQFRYLADNLAVGIFIHRSGILRYAGREGARLLGYDSPEELIGRLIFDFVHPEDRERVAAIARRRVEGKAVPDQYEARLLKKDGSVIDVELYSTLTEYEGQVATQGVFVDVTARKSEDQEVRQSQESLQVIIDSMPFGVMITGRDKRIRRANQSALASMGYESEALVIGRMCHETMCPADADRCPILDLGQRLDRSERVLLSRDGGEIPILKSAVPVTLEGEELLLEAFVDVTEQKRLEQQIQESLERRGRQVQTATEIAQEIAAAPDLGELYQKVVTLVKERFGYYHAQLFLLNDEGDKLVTVAGYGQVGRQMVQRRHSIQMEEGVVGRAAAGEKPILSSDVSRDPDWLYHPLLPNTKAELAVPIILQRAREPGKASLTRRGNGSGDASRGRVLGVLDVQSNRAGALTADDRILLEGLCGQIAVAIESTRLRQETDEYLQELERLTRIMSREGWETFRYRAGSVGYLFNESTVVPAVDFWAPEVGAAAGRREFTMPTSEKHSMAVAPLNVRGGELIGVLGVQDDPEHPLSQEDMALIESVSEQVAQALESARQLDEEQRASTLLGMRVDELDCLNDIGRKLDEAPPVAELLPWVADRIPAAMQFPDLCRVAIEFQDKLYGASEAARLSHHLERSLRIGGESVGKLWIAYTERREFLEEERALLGDIARRVGGYIENRHLLQETRLRAQQLEAINEVGRTISSVLDLEALLRQIVDTIKERFGYYFVGIMLVEGDEIIFRDGSTVGGGGIRLGPGRQTMDLKRESSLVIEAARAGQPMLSGDVLNDPRYSPVEEMPDTRSELDVPIMVRGRVIGVLDVQSDQPFAYTQEDVTLVQSLANQAGVAIENARLFEQTQRRLQELTMLFDVSQALSSAPLQYQEIANIIAQQFVRVMGVPVASVCLVEPERETLRILADACAGATEQDVRRRDEGTTFSLVDYPDTARAMATLQPLVVQASDPDADRAELDYMRVCESSTLAIIPLAVKGQAIGVVKLEARDRERDYTAGDLTLAMTLANQAAVSLENARLLVETQVRAEEQAILNETARALAAAQDVDSVLSEAYRGVSRLVDASDFHVMLYDPEDNKAMLAMRVVDGQVEWPRTVQPVEQLGLIEHLVTTRQPLLIPDRVSEYVGKLGLSTGPLSPGRVSASWLGVPMQIRDQVLGTMVVLSYTTPRAYDMYSQELLSAVANQTALALENVRLLESTQAALAEVQTTHRSYLRQAWQQHLRQRDMLARSGFLLDQFEPEHPADIVAAIDLWRPEMERAVATGMAVSVRDSDGGKERAALAAPITLRGQILGVIGVEEPAGNRQWTEDEVALVQSVSEQLAQALESARLFADTQRGAERERLIGEITAKIRASTDMKAILETTAAELGQVLGTSRALVRLTTGQPGPGHQAQSPGPSESTIDGQRKARNKEGDKF